MRKLVVAGKVLLGLDGLGHLRDERALDGAIHAFPGQIHGLRPDVVYLHGDFAWFGIQATGGCNGAGPGQKAEKLADDVVGGGGDEIGIAVNDLLGVGVAEGLGFMDEVGQLLVAVLEARQPLDECGDLRRDVHAEFLHLREQRLEAVAGVVLGLPLVDDRADGGVDLLAHGREGLLLLGALAEQLFK